MRIEPDIAGTQIVLLGAFNPAIFTPAWFALHGLLSEAESESAKLEIAHNQVTHFRADWFNLQVTQDRFLIDTTQAPHVRIRDQVLRIFGEYLSHTPVTALGINSNIHGRARNKEEWNRIGTTLAPPSAWGPWCGKLDLDGESAGMKSLMMSQLAPADRPEGSAINVTVEPSTQMGPGQPGVFVGINHHFVTEGGNSDSSRGLMDVLDQYFDECVSMSNAIFMHVMSLGHETRG
ncbi:MAG: hypothetical protein OXF03_03540 [Gammaproteobacteria bacterium]|nr:hypothetical protein [Gammaproteobacteria bacterium]